MPCSARNNRASVTNAHTLNPNPTRYADDHLACWPIRSPRDLTKACQAAVILPDVLCDHAFFRLTIVGSGDLVSKVISTLLGVISIPHL